ncbi:hypothetical protein [Rhizobium sp. BK176]|uniref:hypothetical protein n=1 Tax=Rhizobium sp. BK176 TaxID=2587071 RepID=UPI0021692FDB|nr:hypothetical protein [Rhizobium sp. BK176]MCS4090071.1 hypothetical protein [Rhizobium sp. BK176]
MKQIIAPLVIFAVGGFLALKAVDLGNSVATEGMAALNAKYQGKCVPLADGTRGTILGIRSKTIRLAVTDAKGTERVLNVKRVPLDNMIVPCQTK